MTPNERILKLLRRNKSMMYKEIKSRCGLTNIEMNRASLKLRQSGKVVSVKENKTKRWYDKAYADENGIQATEIKSVKWSNTDKGESPYIERMNLINSLWRVAV